MLIIVLRTVDTSLSDKPSEPPLGAIEEIGDTMRPLRYACILGTGYFCKGCVKLTVDRVDVVTSLLRTVV
ncbi:hypothetical protein, partial [Longimycelium tulufanense]|uniref:hypothetical protein n=1 Tax=Longimycelium tulufanense TaxID=907463 RepID=UPI001E38925B